MAEAIIGIGTALASATSALTSTAIGTILVNTALQVGLTYGVQLLNSAFADEPERPGFSQEFRLNDDTRFVIPVGKIAYEGDLVHVNFFPEPKNRYLQIVKVLSDIPCGPLHSYCYLNGERVTLNPQPVVNNETARYHVAGYTDKKIVVRYYDGTQTAADPELVDNAVTLPWPNTSVLRYKAYVSITFDFDDEKYVGGLPNIKFVFQNGARFYDPRFDSTNGGTGSHRLTDWSTWEPTGNPWVVLYHVQRGVNINGIRIFGCGRSDDEVDRASFVAAMNNASIVEDDGDGGTEFRYRTATLIRGGVAREDYIRTLLKSCAGDLVEKAGVLHAIMGDAYTPVASVTYADFFADEPFEFSQYLPAGEVPNWISGFYADPGDEYNKTDIKPVRRLTDEALDKGLVQATLDLSNCVISQGQCERMTSQAYRIARCERNGKGTLPTDFRKLTAGDWINLDLRPRYNFNGMAVVTRTQQLAAEFGDEGSETRPSRIAIEWREQRTTNYTLEPGTYGPRYQPTAINVSQTYLAKTVSNFGVSVITRGVGNKRRSFLRFHWDPPDDRDIRQVLIEYEPADGSGDPSEMRVSKPERGYSVLLSVPSGIQYRARATIVTRRPRQTLWTNWETPPVISDLSEQQQDALDALRERVGGVETQLGQTLEMAVTLAGDLQNNADGRLNSLSTVAQSISTDVRVVQSELASVRAMLGGSLAEALFQMEATATPDEARSVIAFKAKAAADRIASQAAMYLIAQAGGPDGQDYSQILFAADRALFGSGDPTVPANFIPFFEISGGGPRFKGQLLLPGSVQEAGIADRAVTDAGIVQSFTAGPTWDFSFTSGDPRRIVNFNQAIDPPNIDAVQFLSSVEATNYRARLEYQMELQNLDSVSRTVILELRRSIAGFTISSGGSGQTPLWTAGGDILQTVAYTIGAGQRVPFFWSYRSGYMAVPGGPVDAQYIITMRAGGSGTGSGFVIRVADFVASLDIVKR